MCSGLFQAPGPLDAPTGVPFSQQEYHKAGVESLTCHHLEEWKAAERSLAPENLQVWNGFPVALKC